VHQKMNFHLSNKITYAYSMPV